MSEYIHTQEHQTSNEGEVSDRRSFIPRAFHNRGFLESLFGIAFFVLYFLLQFQLGNLLIHIFGLDRYLWLLNNYHYATTQIPLAVAMVACYLVWRRLFPSNLSFRGRFNRLELLMGMVAVASIYLAAHLYSYWQGIAPEPYMLSLYEGKGTSQVISMLLVVIIVVPITEELVFRFFFTPRMDYLSSKCAALMVAYSALFFAGIHMFQYHKWVTFFTLLPLALVLGYYRWRSRGLLLPIILHGFASCTALVCLEIFAPLY